MYKIPVKKIRLLNIIMFIMVVFTLIVSLFAGFFIEYIRTSVNGSSMAPTLNSTFSITGERDIVYINRFAKVSCDDIVVLDLRNNPNFGNYAIKRLIAMEGDIVNIVWDNENRQYNLIVNDKIVESKPYKSFGYNTYDSFIQYISNHEDDSTRVCKDSNIIKGIIVKKDEVFVLGDNWDVSKDSSLVGPISKNSIVGKVDIIIKPTQNELWTILKRIF